MSSVGSVKKIGILGNVGNGNLGDEAIFAAMIDNLRRCRPGVELRAFTLNPDDTQQRHEIPAFPARQGSRKYAAPHSGGDGVSIAQPNRARRVHETFRARLKGVPLLYRPLKGVLSGLRRMVGCVHELLFLARSYRRLKGLDVLIIAGSGPLFDYFGGSWGYPYTLFKWSILAKASRTKLAFVSVGAGPIGSPLSRFFIRRSLSLASFRSYRDESSRKLIELLPVSAPNHVFPDLAFSWRKIRQPPCPPHSPAIRAVGINPMPFFAPSYWPEPNVELYQNYVRHLAAFALWLIEAGYAVVFFPTQLRADPSTIKDIRQRMIAMTHSKRNEHVIEHSISSIEDLLSRIASMEIVVATRFHGIALSYLMGKPVLGISYHRKTQDLMTDLGQADYCVEAARLDLNALVQRFRSLEGKKHMIRDELKHKIGKYRSALDDQYEQILALTTDRPRRARRKTARVREERSRHLAIEEGQEP